MKTFFIDIDGVIYKDGKFNKKAINAFKLNNNIIFCSGRGYIRSAEIVHNFLNKHSILIVENGSKIVDYKGNLFYSKKIDKYVIQKLKSIDPHKLDYMIFNPMNTNYYISYSKDKLKYVKRNYKYYKSFYNCLYKSKLTQITIKFNDSNYAKHMIEFFKKHKINVCLSEKNIIINEKNISKKSAIKIVLKKYNIRLEDVILIGNDYNDVEMFKLNAKNKIAVIDEFTPKELINLSNIKIDFDNLYKIIDELDN